MDSEQFENLDRPAGYFYNASAYAGCNIDFEAYKSFDVRTSDTLDNIFVPAEIYNRYGTGDAAANIAALTAESVVFQDGVNVNFIDQLKALQNDRPYIFYGGSTRKGCLHNELPVEIYNTGGECLKVQDKLTVIPVIGRTKIVPVNFRSTLVFPVETVELLRFKADMNAFLKIQKFLATLVKGNNVSELTSKVGFRAYFDNMVQSYLRGNMIWDRVVGAVSCSGHYPNEGDINSKALEIISDHWWPAINPEHIMNGHFNRDFGRYTTTGELFNKLVTYAKTVDIEIAAECAAFVTALKASRDGNIQNIVSGDEAKKIIRYQSFWEFTHAIMEHFRDFTPLQVGIITSSGAGIIPPGGKMLVQLTAHAM